jgi:hypothetical protein
VLELLEVERHQDPAKTLFRLLHGVTVAMSGSHSRSLLIACDEDGSVRTRSRWSRSSAFG